MKTEFVGLFDWHIIHDRRRMEAALAALDGVRKVGEDEWTWHDPSPAGRRLVGMLYIVGDSLVLETRQEDDAERCCSRLQSAAGGAVEFLIGEKRAKEAGSDLGEWTRSRLAERASG